MPNISHACVAALLALSVCSGQSTRAYAAAPVAPAGAESGALMAAPVQPASAPVADAPLPAGIDDEEDPSLPALDQSVVKEIILSHMNAVKHCYNQELKKDAALAGKVIVKFTVGSKGPVTSASIKQSTLNNKDVEECMVKEVKTWIFPEPRRGETVDISFPFVFKPTT